MLAVDEEDANQMWTFVIILLVTIIGIICFKIFSSNLQNKSPPGPWGLPIFGCSLFVWGSQYQTFQNWSMKYGPLFKIRNGFNTIIILDDNRIIREALKNPAFAGRGDNKVLNIIAGGKYGITSNEGPEWAEQRKFVLKHLRGFGLGKPSMEGIIMAEVEDFLKWAKECGTIPSPTNKRLTLATLNTLWSIVAGRRNPQNDEKLISIIDFADEGLQSLAQKTVFVLFPKLIDILPKYFLSEWKKAKEGVEGLNKFIGNAIKQHRENPAENPRDLIDAYLTAIKSTRDETSSFYKESGDKSLLAVVKDLFAAGAGATAETINWAILYLVSHLEVQRKFQSEIDVVVGRDRSPTLSDRKRMPYTEAVLNEVLRCSSVVPTLFHFTTEDTTLHGYEIKKNSTVISNIYSVHYNEHIWGDPHNFRPGRFLAEDGKVTTLKSEHLIPFGIGRRRCIGESLAQNNLFLFMTSLFQEFDLIPDPTNPTATLEPKQGFILQAQDFKVVFKKRNSPDEK